ncbi:MAG: YCF48-related protein [Thermocrispum sp.]
MKPTRAALLAAFATTALLAVPAQATAAPSFAGGLTWQLKDTGTTAQFRGLSALGRKVAWVSGSKGTVLRTADGGRTFDSVGPEGTGELDFRDVEALDAKTAVVLSIGPGEDSRIYRTSDGGKTWAKAFQNTEPTAFYNCVSFFDKRNGLAVSDPVDGKFRLAATHDGGKSWRVVPSDGMPPALPGEYGFSASGQCLATHGSKDAWIASGGGEQARVFHSADRGRTWTVSATPLASSESAGVFAVAFRDRDTGIAIGGDYVEPTNSADALALTRDGGQTWREPHNAPAGYRSGVTYHPWFGSVLLAVGPTGSDVSLTGGTRWRRFDDGSFDTVDCTRDGACWASGEKGRVATLALG